jgi:hypothetical protein
MPETTHKLPRYLPYLPEYKMTLHIRPPPPLQMIQFKKKSIQNVFNFVADYNEAPDFSDDEL